ncbi:uncharacterized protein ACRADG_003681 [Cochliomyia hominivorax]
MSENQRQQQHQQQRESQEEKQQTNINNNTECNNRNNRKRKNRRKHSEGNSEAPANKCEIKELKQIAAGDNLECKEGNDKMEKKPLLTSMEQLKMASKPSTPVASRKAAGSNWDAVKKANQASNANEQENVQTQVVNTITLSKSARRRQNRKAAEQRYVAMDCEMVGVGLNGQDDMLARVSIVSKHGEVLLDKFVKPQEAVTDYRTSVSGIRPHDIANAEDFKTVQDEVVQILQGKILVGHAIRNDLSVLHIKHPNCNIRDTSRYKPLCRLVANGRTPSLKRLSQAILGKEIQTGEHNSVEDARAAMSIYNCVASDWEEYIKNHQHRKNK